MRAFRKDWPEVKVAIEQDSSESQVQRLLEDGLDLALLSAATARVSSVEAVTLLRSRFVAMLPSDWPLVKRRSVRLQDLTGLPFVMAPAERWQEVHSAILLACREAGFAPHIAQEASQAYAIEALVASGIGLSLQPALWSVQRLDRISYLPVRDLPEYLYWELAVAWRSAGTTMLAQDAFVAAMQRAAEPTQH